MKAALIAKIILVLVISVSTSALAYDDYPYPNEDPNSADPWNFFYRQCTSFVAWRMNRDRGDNSFTNRMGGCHWGNAENWDENAQCLGIIVDNTPAVGAVAQWNSDEIGSVGHVAFVETVNSDGSVNVSEYNFRNPLAYGERNNIRAPRYIHINPESIRPGFDSFSLPGNDDGSTGLVPIGFPVNFFGTIYDHLYVNNNGNLTFDSRLATYTPFPLQTTNRVIIAPFFADVDTRVGTIVKYGPGTMGGHPAFGVTWPGVGCYNTNIRVLNYFQVVLIDRSDTGAGDFDIEYNYDQIQWETGTASGGNSDCLFGSSARVGYSNGVNTSFELLGSGIPGSFLDSNPITGLVYNSRNSLQPGRYLFNVRNGIAPTGGTISGAIYGDSAAPGNEVAGAFVQVCGTGGFCNTTTTGISGQYSVSGLQADSYNIRAFPPGGSTLAPDTIGPIQVVGNEAHAGQDIVLHAPPPPPPNPVSPAHSGGGTVVVYWHDPLTLTAQGCPNGTANYQITVEDGLTLNGPLTETPAGSGTYIATIPPFFPHHGVAHIVYTINCPGGSDATIEFDIYIDPSGVVKTTSGDPIQGATVTLLRADTAAGPFVQVPNGSGIMSPSNRNNPDTTNAFGLFGWDVIAGFYKIRAEKSECYAPGNSDQLFVESTVLQVPPPATNLELILECPWPSSLPGDLNNDGLINTADYTVFRTTLGKCTGQAGFNADADYDGDGCVTYADYKIWYGYFKNQ